MQRSSGLRRTIEATVAVILLAHGTSASAGLASSFVGRVHDAGGAAVAGAMVTATQPQLKRSTTVYTNDAGVFQLPPLDFGVYDVRVRRAGYEDLLHKGMRLAQVPVSYRRRASGTSFITPRYLWKVPMGMAREVMSD